MRKYFLIPVVAALLFGELSYAQDATKFSMAPQPRKATSSARKSSPSSNRGGFINPFAAMKFGFGMGVNVPDVFPVEGYAFLNSFFALRVFVVPTIPFNVIVQMPRDKISSAGGLMIEHPALDIPFRAKYGPQYGAEAMWFPFGDDFFLSFGSSFRKLAIKGGVESPLLLTAESTGTSTTTNTNFRVDADAATSQIVTRFGGGWLWKSGQSTYFALNFGYTMPRKASSDVNVYVNVRNPNTNDQVLSSALKDLKAAKEKEATAKAKEAVRPAEELALPVLGLTFGVIL